MSISPVLKEALAANLMSGDKGLSLMPFYLSGWLDSMMMGVVVCQTISYGRYIKRDRRPIVALVLVTVASTTAATILIVTWMARLFVRDYGSYLPFTESIWLVRYMAIEIVTIFLTQTYYIHQACRLYAHWFPAPIIAPVSLGTVILGSVSLHVFRTNFENITFDTMKDPVISSLCYTWLSLTIVTDCLIPFLIAYGLYRVKTGYELTDPMIKRLITRGLETQTPALISSIVTIAVWRHQFQIALLFVILQTKVYTLGLLLSLNLRGTGTTKPGSRESQRLSSAVLPDTNYPMLDLSSGGLDVSVPSSDSGWTSVGSKR